jgi:hypothetical protein
VFLNGAMIFDLIIGLLLCSISSIKGASYCLPISVALCPCHHYLMLIYGEM